MEREMDDAFESDDDHMPDHGETTPLTIDHQHRPILTSSAAVRPLHIDADSAGIYDFERDYDCPPPGSPPRPSSFAIPNSFGNSNGLLPTSPVTRRHPRTSFFRRAVDALLPSQVQRVPTQVPRYRHIGGGIENDGVFANVMAKPGRAVSVTMENGDVYMVPEETQSEAPPVRTHFF